MGPRSYPVTALVRWRRMLPGFESSIIAILRGSTPDPTTAVAETLAENGVELIELTMSTPGAMEMLALLAGRFPSTISLGMGTVLDGGVADRAIAAGAQYLVTPTVEPDVIAHGTAVGVPVFAGAMTPTEIAAAWRLGATAVKVFPVASLGGVDYINAVRAPLPDIPLVATGGVDLDQVGGYLDAGCVGVGIGSPLIADAMAGGSLSALADRTRRAVAAAQGRGE